MDLRLSKAVKEVIILQRDDRGRRIQKTLYRQGKRRKRGSAPLDNVGRVVRKIVAGGEAAAQSYLSRHEQSNRKRPDGWVRDLPYNVFKATRRGLRKVSGITNLPSID
jgi:hypothetical protein